MKIYEIINPSDINTSTVDDWADNYGGIKNYNSEKLEKVLDFITTHCDVLPIMQKNNTFLYRGIGGISNRPVIFHGLTPISRLSIWASPYGQQLLDHIFELNNFPALRKNSICTTSKVEMSFGATYLIFPLTGFNFTWSARIKDIGSNSNLYWELKDFNDSRRIDAITRDEAKKFVDKWEFFGNKHFDMALRIGNEIIINGQYIAISGSLYGEAARKYFGITD
jgi:hypothetical protein